MLRRFQPRFFVIVISVLVLVFGVCLNAAGSHLRAADNQLNEALSLQKDRQRAVNDLQEQLAYAQTDAYVMQVARDELGLLMPGEIRYVSAN